MYWLVEVHSGKRVNPTGYGTEQAAIRAANSISVDCGGKRIDVVNVYGHIVFSVGGK